MAFSEALAERIRQRFARRKNVEEKKMFGGVGFLLNGNMLVGIWKDSLIVRLGPDDGDEALLEPHVNVREPVRRFAGPISEPICQNSAMTQQGSSHVARIL